MTESPESILEFWFADAADSPEAASARAEAWFAGGHALDRTIASRYGALPDRASAGELDAWREAPDGALALVLVLDQFPRNLFRGEARAFAFDAQARNIAGSAIESRFDERLDPLRASFLYMPFEHSEEIADQKRAVRLFEALVERASPETRRTLVQFLDYAVQHRDVIRRFGRFPHRNDLLGRSATSEEIAYLQSGGQTFSG